MEPESVSAAGILDTPMDADSHLIPMAAEPRHFADILALNAASVHFLSPLTPERLAHLHQHAAYHTVLLDGERVLAFLLAFAPGAPYDSVNYRWFDARFADFLYVDRIVVADTARGLGLASRLYRDLFEHARAHGYGRVVCEFDVDPPNPASERFHRNFGFAEVGSQRLAGGKTVSLQSAPVPAAG